MVNSVETSIWRLQQISKISKLRTRLTAKLNVIPKNWKHVCEHLSLNCICNIVIGFFFAYRPAFLAVVLGYHRAIKKQPQGVFEKKIIKNLQVENICFSCLQWIVQGPNYNVTAKNNSQIIFDSRWQATNMTKFRYFEYQNFARSGLNRFYLFSLKKLNIRTNWPCFGYFGTRVYQYRKYERNQFFGCVRDFDDHIWFLLTLTLKCFTLFKIWAKNLHTDQNYCCN